MKTRMEQKDSFLQTMYVSIENEKLDVSADYCAYTRGGYCEASDDKTILEQNRKIMLAGSEALPIIETIKSKGIFYAYLDYFITDGATYSVTYRNGTVETLGFISDYYIINSHEKQYNILLSGFQGFCAHLPRGRPSI